MERLMLLDGNGLIYRGYFALINVPLSTSKGELVNAVFGFSNIVLRGFQDVRPDYVAIAFDLPAPTFRHGLSADYKATRRPMPDDLRAQFPKVREVVAALRLPVFELAGFEADDVIGTLTREAEGRDLETTIVTGDLDMLQLVTDRTRLMTTRMGVDATVVYDPARIRERYGLEASQMIDFKSLKGDSTDNIPGVPGVGDKTAAKLVSQFGGLDALYEHLDEVTPEKLREKLREHHDRVLASRELVTIHRDLPVALDLDAARFGEYDRDEVVRLFREYEFRTLIDRLPPLRGATGAQEGAAEPAPPGGSEPSAPGMAPIPAPGQVAAVRPSFGSAGA
ncbi:MAG: 5'-3' exonuclease H3TH domain-containing protein, partial [Candidatus Limnocylindrales bacterium]|nr:5'-3' exonuclease H3TH domain-containing protein [Candidatus Limnocylindrales bacterium]